MPGPVHHFAHLTLNSACLNVERMGSRKDKSKPFRGCQQREECSGSAPSDLGRGPPQLRTVPVLPQAWRQAALHSVWCVTGDSVNQGRLVVVYGGPTMRQLLFADPWGQSDHFLPTLKLLNL